MDRSNDIWLAQLAEDGPQQQVALGDLRDALLRGLHGALSSHPRANEAFFQDAVQDALLRILDRLPQFEGRSRFVTWATSIAIRVALSELRRRRWKDVSLDALMEQADSLPVGGVEAEQATLPERQAIVEKMHEVIHSELTEKQRAALLAELKGMPQDEIARHLGSNRNAIYKLTHDARKRLKQGLEGAGYGADTIRAAFS